MADTSVKLSGTYDSIEAYNIMVEMQNMSADYEEIRTEAAAAASAATAAVTTAQTAANSASTYAGNAQTYAGNANTSAGEAAGYASDASTSASNAATSETNASNSASAAATSAADAAASEAVVAGALPLSGGTMTGNIAWAHGEVGYRSITHTAPYDPCRQMIVTAGTVDSEWNDGNAKLALHTFDSTGVNTAENGGFDLLASDGTNSASLTGRPGGSLTWANNNVMTEKTETGTITATRGTLTGGTLRKRGNIVELSFEVSSVGAGAKAWTTFLNIPNGFRPIEAFDFPIVDNSTGWSVQGKITSSGDLSVWPPSTTISTVRGHVVYFV